MLTHRLSPELRRSGDEPLEAANTVEESIALSLSRVSSGRRLGPYALLDRIGRGGMGEIWRAEDTRLARQVAVKLLPAERAEDPRSKARLLREARAAAALDHPNICSVYEVGETTDRQLYFVMPCYGGEPLQERIARGPLPVSEVLDLAGQIARGLAEAHRNGIIHRDIKPANLMVTRSGVVKILDFGVAKLSGHAHLTRVGCAVGTLAYMSPEQLRGEPVDERADLWSLGVVIYEMLTARHPFPGAQTALTQDSILHAEPKPLQRDGEIPAGLDRLVRALLSKNPAERLPSAASVAAVLQEIVAGASGRPWGRPSWRAAARRLGIGLSALGLIVAGGVAVSGRESAPPSPAESRPVVAMLGFQDLSAGASERWLGPALTEMLTAELAAGGGLQVVSRERTARAGRAVKGSYLLFGDGGRRRIRLDVRILAMPTGDTVASAVEVGREPELLDLVTRTGRRLRSLLPALGEGSREAPAAGPLRPGGGCDLDRFAGYSRIDRSFVSRRKSPPMITVRTATATGYQRP
jgi:hypothetical protein